MNKNRLVEAIGQIDETLVTAYEQDRMKRRRYHVWRKPAVLAACLCLVAFGLFGAVRLGLLGFGASSGGSGSNADQAGYMFYPGPVFPLAVLEQPDGLTAIRDITFDFAPYETQVRSYEQNIDQQTTQATYTYYERSSLITDRYILANSGSREKSVTLVYPFTGSLSELEEIRPVLSLNGQETKTELVFGPYSGGFAGAWPLGNDRQDDATLNLDTIKNWQGYQTLLADGSYMAQAFTTLPPLDQPAIVYTITDYAVVGDTGTNPSLGVHYTAGSDTTVLSYGFHGLHREDEGRYIQGFSLPRQSVTPHAGVYCLIVLGEDIRDLRLQGYQDMGLKAGTEIEVSARIERTEAVLADIVRPLLLEFRSLYQEEAVSADDASFIRQYQATVELLMSHGLLGNQPVDRYDTGWLMDLFGEANQLRRVMYLLAEVSIPAEETATVTATMTRKGSHDFYCRNRRDRNIEGYDLVTQIGSNLPFSGQQATIADRGLIEIVRQNFGFDLAQDIRTVPLSLAEAHYFMEIRKLADNP